MSGKKSSFLLFLFIGFYACNPFSNESELLIQDCGLDLNLEVCEADSNMYDYCLDDINSSSCTFGEDIGPSYLDNQVTLHYFGHQY